jgi:adenylate kinase
MKLLMLGPPGVGKGTQAKKLSHKLGIPHISTGDLLREHIAKGTSLGLRAKESMDRGELVSQVIGMVQYRLDRKDCEKGFILDGYPRTLSQGERMEDITQFDRVLSMSAPEDVIISRLTKRRLCSNCGAIYHLEFAKPETDVCDKCSGELYQREDDKEKSVVRRLEIFKKMTEPLVGYYINKELLVSIDGSGSPEEVEKLVSEACSQTALRSLLGLSKGPK